MPSPFPGMDPYIEDVDLWRDFHAELAAEIKRQLAPQIRPRYFVRTTPRRTYESVELGKPRSAYPDAAVMQTHPTRLLHESTVAYAAIAEPPFASRVEIEVEVEDFSLEIRDENSELVTAIEILSRVNKRRGHEAYNTYREKRRGLLRQPVHLLEIDLLRVGERVPILDPVPDAPYYVYLSRENLRPDIGVWAIQLQDVLPKIPIPLRKPDADAVFDLQRAVETIYDLSMYDESINYREPPPPPALSTDEARCLDEFLSAKGLR